VKRPRLHRRDRVFWVWLSRLWRGWRSSAPTGIEDDHVLLLPPGFNETRLIDRRTSNWC
jgi:hypothetical protein